MGRHERRRLESPGGFFTAAFVSQSGRDQKSVQNGRIGWQVRGPMALTPTLERLLEHPWVYAAWQTPFVAQKFAPVERALRHEEIRRVLDVGCGPGTNAARFRGFDYVGVDIND